MKRGVVSLVVLLSAVVLGNALVFAQFIPPGMQQSLNMINSMYGTSYACSPCHTPSGPPLNGFGQAFVNAGGNPDDGDTVANRAALVAIQPLDSDTDGFSNIAEINARTLPGDAASIPSVTVMPSPVSGQTAFDIPAQVSVFLFPDPLRVFPLEFGAVAQGGSQFRVGVALPAFSSPVDLYFGVSAPVALQSPDVFLLTESGDVVSASQSLAPWKKNVSAATSVAIMPDLALSNLPDDVYTFYLVATPANSLSTFYLWVSDFTVGPRDLTLRLRGMADEVGRLTEARIVANDSTYTLRTRAVFDPIPSADLDLSMPKAVPAGNHWLDLFADLSGNGAYNAPPPAPGPNDHAWRVPLPATGVVDRTFVHNASFADIGAVPYKQGGTFTLNLSGMTPHVGQLMELRVIKLPKKETVGYYRLGTILTSNFSLIINGVIESGVAYQVDFYADFNNNKTYNAPPADHAWRLTGTGNQQGLTLNFSHNTTFTDIGF